MIFSVRWDSVIILSYVFLSLISFSSLNIFIIITLSFLSTKSVWALSKAVSVAGSFSVYYGSHFFLFCFFACLIIFYWKLEILKKYYSHLEYLFSSSPYPPGLFCLQFACLFFNEVYFPHIVKPLMLPLRGQSRDHVTTYSPFEKTVLLAGLSLSFLDLSVKPSASFFFFSF